MENLIYVPAFVLALGIIVFVHELGHHVVARLCGVRVLIFSFGFGKRLWGFPRVLDHRQYREDSFADAAMCVPGNAGRRID